MGCPAPLASLKEALAIDDIVIVQPPAEAKDLLKEGYQPQPGEFALVSARMWKVRLWFLTRILAECCLWWGAMITGYQNLTARPRRWQPWLCVQTVCLSGSIDKGYSPTTRILDAPLAVDQGRVKPKWKIHQFTKQFYGPSIMR